MSVSVEIKAKVTLHYMAVIKLIFHCFSQSLNTRLFLSRCNLSKNNKRWLLQYYCCFL